MVKALQMGVLEGERHRDAVLRILEWGRVQGQYLSIPWIADTLMQSDVTATRRVIDALYKNDGLEAVQRTMRARPTTPLYRLVAPVAKLSCKPHKTATAWCFMRESSKKNQAFTKQKVMQVSGLSQSTADSLIALLVAAKVLIDVDNAQSNKPKNLMIDTKFVDRRCPKIVKIDGKRAVKWD